jgi:hypothetical protein
LREYDSDGNCIYTDEHGLWFHVIAMNICHAVVVKKESCGR